MACDVNLKEGVSCTQVGLAALVQSQLFRYETRVDCARVCVIMKLLRVKYSGKWLKATNPIVSCRDNYINALTAWHKVFLEQFIVILFAKQFAVVMKPARSLALIHKFHSVQSRYKRNQFTCEHPVFLRSDLMLFSHLRFALFCLFYHVFKKSASGLHISSYTSLPYNFISFNNVRWKRRDLNSFIMYSYHSPVNVLS
jgi:hypothetical protein